LLYYYIYRTRRRGDYLHSDTLREERSGGVCDYSYNYGLKGD